MKNRGPRCAHGFLRGMCTERDCAHWDGVKTQEQAARMRRGRDAGGRNQYSRQRRTN